MRSSEFGVNENLSCGMTDELIIRDTVDYDLAFIIERRGSASIERYKSLTTRILEQLISEEK
jgi:hypothetical protein